MALRMRAILPYALPGVLALVGCWWFYSRKKEEYNKKRKRLISAAELQTDDALKELVPKNVLQTCSRVQPVQLNGEAFASQDSLECAVPSAAQVTASSENQTDCKAEDSLLNEYPTQSVLLYTLQGSCLQAISEEISFIVQAGDGDVGTPTTVHNANEETNTIIVCSGDVAEVCTTSLWDHVQGMEPNDKSEEAFIGSCEENLLTHNESNLCSTEIHKSSFNLVESIMPLKNTSEELHVQSFDESSVEACVDEIETVVKMSLLVQCPPSVVNETGETEHACSQSPECNQAEQVAGSEPPKLNILAFMKASSEHRNADICESIGNFLPATDELINSSIKSSSIKVITEGNCPDLLETISLSLGKNEESDTTSSLMDCLEDWNGKAFCENCDPKTNSCVKPSSGEIVREGKCTDILDAFSQCLGKKDQFETTGSTVACLGEENPNTFFGNYEAKIVEQLAMNIISKVIVAAKQEILSGSRSDVSGTCQVFDEKKGKDYQSRHSSRDENEAQSSGIFEELNSACEYTQTEQSQVKDFRNTVVTDDSCLELQRESMQTIPNVAHTTQSLSNFSPVHQSVDFLDESQAAMEDSSTSVCTSEEGISMEEPLQSTVMSNVGIGSYDSLSSSAIELSTENFNVFSERQKNVGAVENKTVSYSNGDVKKCPADMKNEGPWTGDTEVDHSGGSDVNSMDSVDSGYALGKSEEDKTANQKNGARTLLSNVWEFEVPKHLVGRLIGKQGRFVSFLKESSGARIYICTVPFTQDYQMCHLEGTQQQIDRALFLIRKKFKELNLRNLFALPPSSMALHSLPMTSWLMLPDGVTVEVIVVNVVNAGHMFVQQHTHPTFHALRDLDQHMFLCYSQSGIPTLPTPVEVGVICAAPMGDDAWWRAQVVAYYSDSEEVEIRYVDYGGYERVKVEILRQIRSDFVSLPFQGAEVLLDNVIPVTDEDHFSTEADVAANEMTKGTALLAQVTNYDGATGLPLVQLWSMVADEVVSINRTLVERGFAQWIDGF
ncbi:A-kinase anchor protein 1, mitochondrial [Pseudophryne corroboree]|uniref:A-kinase anchor protein 1, mitochondrial n=1 Tax=Pseudophryne corroboree TaxID=495146 RepID=UPI003081C8D3